MPRQDFRSPQRFARFEVRRARELVVRRGRKGNLDRGTFDHDTHPTNTPHGGETGDDSCVKAFTALLLWLLSLQCCYCLGRTQSDAAIEANNYAKCPGTTGATCSGRIPTYGRRIGTSVHVGASATV